MTKSSFVNTLSGRLILFGVVPFVLAIGAIVAVSAVESFRELRRAEERTLGKSAEDTAAELSALNERCNNIAAVMALAQADGMFGQRNASSEFARAVATTVPRLLGAYVIYEPNADGQDDAALKGSEIPRNALDAAGRFVPYWYFDSGPGVGGGPIRLKPNTDMETLEYYLGPKHGFEKTHEAAATLTEPYLYEGVLMVSHTYPIVVQGKFVGITGVDRSLDTLAQNAASIQARLGADVFVLSGGDRFIVATSDGGDAAAGPQGLRLQEVAKSPYGTLAARWRSADPKDRVFETVDPVLGEPCIYATGTAQIGGWRVVVRRTKSDVLRGANAALARNVTIGGLGLVMVGGLMVFISRSVSRRVRRAAEVADRIAHGDLTQQIDESSSRDETGGLIRSMSIMDRSLNSLVGSVRQAGIRLNSTATEIAATSKQQEASASTFGSASSQIAAAVNEISATAKELGRAIASVSENATGTAKLAESGRAGMQGMESVMHDLDRATVSIAEKLGVINERSQKITTIIATITKVADQTNILSINAAIEAEKAGEFGAGFLVIAREIRRLADQTGLATLDIEEMVQQMQAAVSSGVMEMDRFSDQVRRGVRDVASVGSQLSGIVDRIGHNEESVKQVNESMQAQSEGAQQISEAMASLTSNAQQTMQSVHEFGKASTDLQTAIGVLRQAVAQFKLKD
ncbi:MAG: methyl-accepting chemotaxis protein [Phycisphaerales bacterium]|nr:methyl-accepting chemotaxis protein [Phycisphaerales bacterium]